MAESDYSNDLESFEQDIALNLRQYGGLIGISSPIKYLEVLKN